MSGHVALSYAFVAIGGAAGAMARFALTVFLQRGSISIPWGTLTTNLLGCFLIGIIAQLVAQSSWFNEAGWIEDQYRLLFAVGFCGSFTTLSAFVLEINTLLQRNDLFGACLYLALTFVGAFVSFFAGVLLMKAIFAVNGN